VAAVRVDVVDRDEAGLGRGLPLTAASRPRLALRFSDSCGESIGVVVSSRLDGVSRVGHVEHGDPLRTGARIERVEGKQQVVS